MEPLEHLKGKTVAIVGLGNSWFDYNLAKSHGTHFDEVWAINAVGSVIFHDRVFMMDPASRFFDSTDAGGQTSGMLDVLKNGLAPVYTCELDDRCRNLVEYPIDEVLQAFNCHYLNNTVSYAIAFALWNKVGAINLYGVDFSYKSNLHFAESGRACVEYWLAKATELGVEVGVAGSSALLDTNVPDQEKLYGYHRLKDPLVVMQNDNKLITKKVSELASKEMQAQPTLIGRNDEHLREPDKW